MTYQHVLGLFLVSAPIVFAFCLMASQLGLPETINVWLSAFALASMITAGFCLLG